MAYDFTTLSPSDFEVLIADLFSSAWSGRLEAFKAGKDQGIDLLHSRVPASEKKTIVQCKRYAPDKFDALLRSVKLERKKLDRLKPERYVLATSVKLSLRNKRALVVALAPYCASTSDIYGPKELNGLLRDFPDVEHAHFKLWISSTAILERVLHGRIFAITDATVEAAKYQVSKLVVHEGLNRALGLLQSHGHVLIVGNPGIGKTTLARMLMCHYIRDKFQPVWVVGDIEDAWTVVHGSANSARKLVIVYDDFLGQLQFDSRRFKKNEDQSLMALLDKVARSGNLRLILTTREYILEDAKRVHGAFSDRANDLLKYTLSLADYSIANRAEVLFNHLFFSDLPDSRLRKLVNTRVYRNIVEHEHFNPRVVESICRHANSHALSDDEYIAFVEKEFDNPSKLWEHPFQQEVSPLSRHVLVVLWSFGGIIELPTLQRSVARLNAALPEEELASQFTAALRQLDGNFIRTDRYPGTVSKISMFTIVQFHNPSVKEFVNALMQEAPVWLRRLAPAVVAMQQVERIAARAREIGDESTLDQEFWRTLRSVAISCESSKRTYLMNYSPYEAAESYPAWFVERPIETEVTEQLLRLETYAKLNDARTDALQARVLTVSGWQHLLEDVAYDYAIARAVRDLQEWLVDESRWEQPKIKLAEQCLRDALLEILDEGDLDLDALHYLISGVTMSSKTLTELESQAFLKAVKAAVDTLSQEDDADRISDGASYLESLGKQLGRKFDTYYSHLMDKVAMLEEKPQRSRKLITRKYEDESNKEFDIDEQFKGLLDRHT